MPPQKHVFIQQIEEIHYIISIGNRTFTQQNDDNLNLPTNSDDDDTYNHLTIDSPIWISQCNSSVTNHNEVAPTSSDEQSSIKCIQSKE